MSSIHSSFTGPVWPEVSTIVSQMCDQAVLGRNLQVMAEEGIFSNMRPDRKAALLERLTTLDQQAESTQEIERILHLLEQHQVDWSEFFKNPHDSKRTDLVLLALLRGQLSEHTAGTVLQFWQLFRFHPEEARQYREVNLFQEDGSINEEARHLIQSTLVLTQRPKDNPMLVAQLQGRTPKDIRVPLYTEEKFDALFEEMRRQPKSEQRLLLLPLSCSPAANLQDIFQKFFEGLEEGEFSFEALKASSLEAYESSILDQTQRVGVNILGRVSDKERMFAPMGLCQAVANHFTAYPSIVCPKIGAAAAEKGGRVGMRDLTVRYFDQPVPRQADGFQGGGALYTEHDKFHLFVQSGIPYSHQKVLLRIAHIAAEISQRYPQEKVLPLFSARLLDREDAAYRADFVELFKQLYGREFTLPEQFWLMVENSYLATLMGELPLVELKAASSLEELCESMIDPTEGFTFDDLTEAQKEFVDAMVDVLFREDLGQSIGLTSKNLSNMAHKEAENVRRLNPGRFVLVIEPPSYLSVVEKRLQMLPQAAAVGDR